MLCASIILAIATIVLVVITFYYACQTKKMAEEMKNQTNKLSEQIKEMKNQTVEMRKQSFVQFNPLIILIRDWKRLVYLCKRVGTDRTEDVLILENIGGGPALDVKFESNWKDSNGEDIFFHGYIQLIHSRDVGGIYYFYNKGGSLEFHNKYKEEIRNLKYIIIYKDIIGNQFQIDYSPDIGLNFKFL